MGKEHDRVPSGVGCCSQFTVAVETVLCVSAQAVLGVGHSRGLINPEARTGHWHSSGQGRFPRGDHASAYEALSVASRR